jgi:hypothetical protein
MCPIGFLMLGSTLQDLPSDSPAACRSACRRRRASLRTGSHQRTILACTRPILVGHAVELATAQPPPATTARSKPTPRLAQQRLRQLRAPGADSGRRRAGHGRSGRPRRPRPSQPYGCLPTPRSRTSLRPDTAHAATHRHRTPTPDADTGQRTPGRSDARTGHRTSVPWTGKRGHWSLAPDTGHRTPAEDVDRLTKARPASGPPGPPRRATARWDAQPCSCGRRLRRWTAHAGSAVRPPSSARSRLAGSCLVAPPGSSGASAHCCPRIRWVESRADREASSVMMEGCAAVIEAKQIAVVAERNWSERCRAPVA